MKTEALKEFQKLTQSQADEMLAVAKMPTYSELLNSLNSLALNALSHEQLSQHDYLRTLAYEAQTLACRALP